MLSICSHKTSLEVDIIASGIFFKKNSKWNQRKTCTEDAQKKNKKQKISNRNMAYITEIHHDLYALVPHVTRPLYVLVSHVPRAIRALVFHVPRLSHASGPFSLRISSAIGCVLYVLILPFKFKAQYNKH